MVGRRLVAAGCALSLVVGVSGAAAAQESVEGVELTIWVNQGDSQPIRDMLARFEEETEHRLDLVVLPADGFEDALQTRWAGGERPDILEWHTGLWAVSVLNATENLIDLSDESFVANSGDLYELNGSVDGKVYAFIMTPPTPFGIFYRRDIFDGLGLEPPTDAEQLLQVCAEIRASDPDIVPLYEAAGSGWPPYVTYGSYMGGPLLNGGWLDRILAREGRIDDPDSPFLGSLRFYQQLQAECHNPDALSATYEDSYSALAQGEAAMVAQHSGILLDMAGAFGDEIVDEIGFTAWSETGPAVTVQGNPSGTFYLPKTGDPAREAAAVEFIRFMSGPAYADFVQRARQYPTLEGVPVPEDVTPALVEAAELIETNGSVNVIWDFLPGLSFDPVNEVVAGTSTPEDAVAQLQLSADQGARAAGLPGWP